jgi:hypothetical protein
LAIVIGERVEAGLSGGPIENGTGGRDDCAHTSTEGVFPVAELELCASDFLFLEGLSVDREPLTAPVDRFAPVFVAESSRGVPVRFVDTEARARISDVAEDEPEATDKGTSAGLGLSSFEV